jgi:hypothetical protein
MKTILFFIFLVPTLVFGQVSSWRGGGTSQPQRSTFSTQPSVSQRNDVSNWRSQPPSRGYDRPIRTKPGSNVIIRDPWLMNGWGWNRWDMWGAPAFGWNFWQPSWYWNDWGYRQPARIYVYGDGKRDTIRGKKPIINFGVQKTTDNQVGGFFTIGNKGYFITEYNASVERDNSTFFPFGNITQVDFPLVKDLHVMIGTVSEDVKWRGRDDLGYITFPKYLDRFTTIKIGTLHDYKNFTLKLDYDPIIRNGTFGLGINL